MAATIYRVAREAGVSASTVSKVLNGKGERHSAATRQRVVRAAARLGYRRNLSARAARTGRFDAVGLLHSAVPLHAVLPEPFWHAAEDEAARRNRLLLVGRIGEDALADPGAMPKVLREWAVDGLLLCFTHGRWGPLEALLERQGVPAVWINTRLRRNCVFPDDRRGAADAARRLLAAGHRRVAYFCVTCSGHYSERDRRRGYLDAMRAAGLAPLDVSPPPRTPFADFAGPALAALRRVPRPTAFVCYGEEESSRLLHAAAVAGLRVPRDFSLVALHGAPLHTLGFAVDTMVLPYAEMVRQAFDDLETLCAGTRTALPARAARPRLHPGGTCAAPPAPPDN